MSDGASHRGHEGSIRRGAGGRARHGVLAIAAGCAALAGGPARADICKYVDTAGNIHYQNVAPERGWRKISCQPGDDARSPGAPANAVARAAPSPAGFPRVDADTQKGRDDMRRKVLNDELAAEEKGLAESRVQYADGAPPPLPEERADADKYRARIARLRQSIALHERNIEALRKEIASIR